MSNPTNLYEGRVAAEWGVAESSRLKTMDGLFAPVAAADIIPPLVERRIGTFIAGRQATFADIGAGTGTTTEELCELIGVDYFAIDVNAQLLSDRATREDRKILGSNTDLPFPDNHFDITHTRAVTGWSNEPLKAISEQLRVTAFGGVAMFSEFDWTHSGALPESQAVTAIMKARAIMMRILRSGGFEPTYGARLAEDVDAVAHAQGVSYRRQETRHELEVGEYRPFLLHSIDTILEQVEGSRGSIGVIATMLSGCRREIADTEGIKFRLPALVTQRVDVIAPATIATHKM